MKDRYIVIHIINKLCIYNYIYVYKHSCNI